MLTVILSGAHQADGQDWDIRKEHLQQANLQQENLRQENLQHEKSPPYRIIAYAGGDMDYWQMDARKLTHINYAFALVNDNSEIYFQKEQQAAKHLAQLQALKAKNPNLKLLVSVGGWGADGFSDAALTEDSRTTFARSAVNMIKHYGLDGIDIDWEFPGQPGPGIKYREEDRENFTLMLKTLREHIDRLSNERGLTGDRRYLLTIASNDNQRFFDFTEMDKLHVYLDFVNVMSYDMFSVGSATTGHHTGLHQSGSDAPDRTTESAIKRHIEAGIPPGQIVLGAAFYGRSWTGVHPEDHGLFQPFDEWYRFIHYSELMENYINRNGFQRHWDDLAKAPFLWNPDSRTFVSYDDPESLRHKAEYVRELGLGGVMYWHHSYDPSQELLGTLHETLQK